MDPIGLSNDSDLMDGPSEESPSEESPSEDSPTDESDWLIRRFRLGVTRRPPCFLPDESDWMSGAPSLLRERDVIGPYA